MLLVLLLLVVSGRLLVLLLLLGRGLKSSRFFSSDRGRGCGDKFVDLKCVWSVCGSSGNAKVVISRQFDLAAVNTSSC